MKLEKDNKEFVGAKKTKDYFLLSDFKILFKGCKIKALRAKTNTYIKTPVRGEESVFVVTGRKEDVEAAKSEILSAADHFTQIRASRRHSQVRKMKAAFRYAQPVTNGCYSNVTLYKYVVAL